MMYEPEKSDSAIVAVKLANKTAVSKAVAELVEPRAGTKGNTEQPHTRRTQCRGSVSQRLDRVRNAARQRKKEKFTALLHHIDEDLLLESFLALKRHAAAGVDIGLDMQYFNEPKRTGVSAYIRKDDRWTDDVMVPGALMPFSEPRRDQLDYLFDTVAQVIATRYPGTALVRSTIQMDPGESLRASEPNPGEFEFSA